MFYKFSYRYLVAKKSTNAINVIAWVSIGAIALVTAAMIIVLSVFNGLSDLVKSLYKGFYTDLRILPISGKVLTLTPEQYAALKKIDGVHYISFVAEEKALLKVGENQSIVTLKGVDNEYEKLTTIKQKIIRGEFELGDAENAKLVLGYGVENALGILSNQIQSKVMVYLPNRDRRFTGKMEDFNSGEALPDGTFAIQQDFDNKYAISNLAFVKNLIGLDSNQYTTIELAVKEESEIERIKSNLQNVLGKNYIIQTKYQQNQSLYNVMKYEKWGVYGIFCLVLLISSFTIIGALTMLVLEKQKDISILKSMGASNHYIRKIFLTEGLLLALFGIGFGVFLGILICTLQQHFHFVKLYGGSFLIDYYPVQMQFSDLFLIISTVAAITFLASYFPAKRAANQSFNLKS